MCGICGVAARDPRAQAANDLQLERMTSVISHRGPDEGGWRADPGVGLGMRRLSIIDLPSSHQPMSNEDGSVHTVFNGEIYNYRELREGLDRRGHRLSTAGDTETIVHLYEEHGPAFVERLRGMFAIAVWDAGRRRLVLTRDRMGVKPLYVSEGDHGLAFASEVKSLIAGGIVEPALDPVAAELFMAYGYVPGPRTLFKGVRKLAPATTLVWEDGAIVQESAYWDPWRGDPQRSPDASWEEDQERLLELLRSSVKARMISDVPIGVMLSGGLDSSLVAALMSEVATGPVKTFSIGFVEDAGSNELGDARRVAASLGSEHHELCTSAVDHPDLLDKSLWHLEEPIADLSNLGFLLLSRLAREHVTVALSGQGADELLGGYRKHQVAAAAGFLCHPDFLRRSLGGVARRAASGSTIGRGLAAAGAADPAERLLAMSRVLPAGRRAEVFTPEFLRSGGEEEIRAPVLSQPMRAGLSPLAETLYLDTRLALVDNLLLYFDKMSMAASLEVRVPFLDHDVVSFCTALPDSRRVWLLRRKELLKRASRGLVDDWVIEKKKRGFFHSALGSWLRVHREEVFADKLLDERTGARGQFRREALEVMVRDAGERGKKASQVLFSILLLEQWQRYWVDADGPGRAAALRPGADAAAVSA
jgi:asparagine synthase (glutamine-hydrolysing)